MFGINKVTILGCLGNQLEVRNYGENAQKAC